MEQFGRKKSAKKSYIWNFNQVQTNVLKFNDFGKIRKIIANNVVK